MAKQERCDEPTPNGGIYSILTYLNERHDIVEKDQATKAIIVEYNEKDEGIFRTYCIIDRKVP